MSTIIVLMTFLYLIFVNGEPIEVVAGAYFQNLPKPITYETAIPIIFWSKSEIYNYYKPTTNGFMSNSDDTYTSPTDKILLDDGDTFGWGFQIADRNHINSLFTDNIKQKFLIDKIRNHKIKFQIVNINLYNTENFQRGNRIAIANNETFIYNRNNEIIQACQNKMLTPNLINPDQIKRELNLLNSKIINTGYELAIKNVNQYFHMRILDCMIGGNILMGLHIPLIRRSLNNPVYLRFITIPFTWKDTTCSMNIKSFDLINITENNNIKVMIPRCQSLKDQLCLITDAYDDNVDAAACAEVIIKGSSSKKVSALCPFSCKKTLPSYRHITLVDPHTYIINSIKEDIEIICTNSSTKFTDNVKVGALIISLPCNCSVLFQDGKKLTPGFPCLNNKEFSIKRLIPASWSKFNTINIPGYGSLSFTTFTDYVEVIRDNLNIAAAPLNGPPSDNTYYFILATTIVSIILSCTTILLVIIFYMKTQVPQPRRNTTFRPPSVTMSFSAENSPMMIQGQVPPVPSSSNPSARPAPRREGESEYLSHIYEIPLAPQAINATYMTMNRRA